MCTELVFFSNYNLFFLMFFNVLKIAVSFCSIFYNMLCIQKGKKADLNLSGPVQ